MTTEDVDTITPQTIINIRPVVAALKEFFGSSQLSQFMDQTNSLSGLTHRRRLSALGAGGLTRERAPIEVRDVHKTHYGRMCPIETPEGPNIGLIGSLASYATRLGARLRAGALPARVKSGSPIGRRPLPGRLRGGAVRHRAGQQPDRRQVRQADQPRAGPHPRRGVRARPGRARTSTTWTSRPTQIVSVATALIPFLEHDDANRALMGSNMMRQAVPLLIPEAPTVGTGPRVPRGGRHRRRQARAPRRHGQVYVDANAVVVTTRRTAPRTATSS